MGHSGLHKSGVCFSKIELIALLIGLLGTITACLANYGWHWNRESLFFMIFSAVPYGFLLAGNYIVRRIVKSRIIEPVTALFAIALTSLSLIVYIKAVIYPSHSSGMIFLILPLCLMVAIPIIMMLTVVGFLIAEKRLHRVSQK